MRGRKMRESERRREGMPVWGGPGKRVKLLVRNE